MISFFRSSSVAFSLQLLLRFVFCTHSGCLKVIVGYQQGRMSRKYELWSDEIHKSFWLQWRLIFNAWEVERRLACSLLQTSHGHV
jgi:hypothetical protein